MNLFVKIFWFWLKKNPIQNVYHVLKFNNLWQNWNSKKVRQEENSLDLDTPSVLIIIQERRISLLEKFLHGINMWPFVLRGVSPKTITEF